jgi:hypothetical protein
MAGTGPSAGENMPGEDSELAQARIAFEVWSKEPPYGTARRDTTLARHAAVHLGNLLRLLAERDARIAQLEADLARYRPSQDSGEDEDDRRERHRALMARAARAIQSSKESRRESNEPIDIEAHQVHSDE